MKELEEVNCEILKVSDLRQLISDRLKNSEDDYGSSVHVQDYDTSNNSLGGFLHGTTYAWMSHGCHLIVFNVKFGENINCCWTFTERITCVSEFPTQPGHLPLLLVGLDNGASRIKDSMGLLCIFDCNTSRVLRAIRTPAGIEQVCVISGGADWEEINDKRADSMFCDMDGIACVVLRNLQHIMIDLQRSSWDDPNTITYMDESSPAELDFSVRKNSNSNKNQFVKERHMAYNLLNNSIEKYIDFNRIEFESSPLMPGNLTSMIICSTKIGCLISGCLGRVIIWQNNGSIGWISRPLEENMSITHLSLLEPTDDPRPFCYLWVVYQDESSKIPPILRMYALLFERKYCEKGTNLYFNLEAEPCLRFEFELEKEDKVVSLSPIEREVNQDQTEANIKRGEDNLLLIASNERILLFDLNQWYKEQMPQTIYDCKNPNSILATYSTRFEPQCAGDKLLSTSYIPSTLKEFPINNPCPAEELFYPNSLSFEWAELSTMRLMSWLTRGIQAELLRKLAITGPIILLQPKEIFHKCFSVGLVPFNAELSFTNDENTQRETLLSLCLEQRWTSFLVKCAIEWSDGSATFLYPSFLKWGVQRASSIKIIADRLCVPLFDQSDSSIGEAEIKTLRFCSQQLECLSNVVGKLILETDDMIKQRKALKRISIYLQVLLWFYDVGLLPEIQDLDEERQLPLSLSFRIPYPYEKLMSIYAQKRDAIKNNINCLQEDEGLFIDALINKECPILKSQWEREGGNINISGYYPPPSLQSLLRSYLTDCYQSEINETECKHQITIYLLMDLAMLLHGSYPGVDQLIKYPSAFKMSPSLIKLTQAFWLLDHEDYKGFLDMMTGQLVSDSDVKSWHHKLVLRTLVRNNQQKLALIYLRIRKPPISSTDDQSAIVNLSVQHGLVQSAFHCRPPSHYAQLLTCFFEACKSYNKLGDILHLALEPEEEEIFVKFLQEDNKSEDMKTLYYLQRCRYAELNNKNLLSQFKNNVPKNMLHTSAAMLTAYDATLPSITKQFSSGMTKTTLETDLESKYPRPMSHYKCINKQQSIYETVIKKAKETSFQSGKSRIPFITAPCSSLKPNESNINISCVLFPTLAYKNRKKRTLDDIYENEDNETLEETKRRKLSINADAKNTSCRSDLNVTLDTPLVKRKSNISNNKATCTETPHSILKIRQLIQNSASSNISITHMVDTDMPDTSTDKNKKINRQIRFSINNPKQNVSCDTVNEEIMEYVPKEISITKSTSEDDTDVFLSPNTSIKSHNETTKILSDDSLSDKSNCYPRPRPSLRRSYLPGRNITNTTTITNLSSTSSNILNTSKDNYAIETNKRTPSSSRLHNSLSATMYSTMILSPSSSFDINTSIKKTEETEDLLDQSTSSVLSCNYKDTVSSTPLVKSKIVKLLDDNKEELTLLRAKEKPIASFKRNERTKISNDNDIIPDKDNNLEEFNEDKSNDKSEHEFRSLFNSFEQELNTADSKFTKEYIENNNKSRNGLQRSSRLINDFDITDDESSDDCNKITLIYESSKSEDDKKIDIDSETDHHTNIMSQPILHFSDVSNITEDGSNNSNDVIVYNDKNVTGDNVTVRIDKRNSKQQIREINELKNVDDSSNDSITNELSRDLSENKIQITNTCQIMLNRINTEYKGAVTYEENISSRMTTSERITTRSTKRINSSKVKKQIIPVKSISEDTSQELFDDSKNTTMTKSTIRRTRSSSLAKDIFSTTTDNKESENVKDKELTRRITRRAASVQKEITYVPTATLRKTRSSSISNIADETNENLYQSKGKSTGRKTTTTTTTTKVTKEEEEEEKKPVKGRLTRSSSTSLITESDRKKEEEITDVVRPTRRRGNSVPKESTFKVIQKGGKSSNTISDISEVSSTPLSQSKKRRNSISSKIVEEITDSPAANTRSRRSSIQSIPEELEISLNSLHNLSETKEPLSNIRTRRATSVDSSSLDLKKRTRDIRKRNIMEDAIIEESTETESQMNLRVTKNTRVQSSKRKRTSSCSENKT